MIGRSKIVGTPVSELLKWHHATVTVCHSKTKNLEDMVKQADILVVAIGKKYILENIIHIGSKLKVIVVEWNFFRPS